MNTIREYIADAIWWLAHQLDKLAHWIYPPFNPDNFEIVTKEDLEKQKQAFRDLMKE